MKWSSAILGFAVGFAVATVIGLAIILPMSREATRADTGSDVHRPLAGALKYIEQSAGKGDYETAAAQLRLLNDRFEEYRRGGPAPADWWQEVVAATQPAR